MESPCTPVTGRAQVAQLVAQSAQHPVIMSKHDTSCPISQAAYRELQQLIRDVAMIDVARDNDLSHELAEQVGVQHESPQVLVLRDGHAVWSASPYAITQDAVAQAVGQE
jgi:bacillithiol system protein YtxJ